MKLYLDVTVHLPLHKDLKNCCPDFMATSGCSCQFDWALKSIDKTINDKESPNLLERAVQLDWQLSRCIRDMNKCDQCSSDLNVIAATESRLEKLFDLLEAARRTCEGDMDKRPEMCFLPEPGAKSTIDTLSHQRDTQEAAQEARHGHYAFSLGRLALNGEDADILRCSLIKDALVRKPSLIRQLREQIQKCARMQGILGSSRYDARQNMVSRQNAHACSEMDSKLQALLGRIYTAIAQTRMSSGVRHSLAEKPWSMIDGELG